MGKVLVLYYICVLLEGEWDIIYMRADNCWHLAPSSFSQALPHPLAPWGNTTSCGDVLLVDFLAWWQELGWFGMDGNDLSLLMGTMTGSTFAHTSSPWLHGMSFIRGWSDWLARPRQCQESVRPWPWFQNTGESFLTLISYDVFTRSRSSTKEEVQKKCFLGKLFYFKVFKDIIKTWFAFQWKGWKPGHLYVRIILGLLNKKSNLAVNALNQKWEWNYLGEAVNEEIRTLISHLRQKL